MLFRSGRASSGLLASSPDCFADSKWVNRIPYDIFSERFNIENPEPAYSVTNYGVRMQLPLRSIPQGEEDPLYLAYLPCGLEQGPQQSYIYAILLRKQRTRDQNQFVRARPDTHHVERDDKIDYFDLRVRNTLYVKEEIGRAHV